MTLPSSMASRIRAGGVSGSSAINPDTMTLVSTMQPLGFIGSLPHPRRPLAVGRLPALPYQGTGLALRQRQPDRTQALDLQTRHRQFPIASRGNIDRDLDVERTGEFRVQEWPASRHRAARNRLRYPSSNMARIVSMVMNIRSGRS